MEVKLHFKRYYVFTKYKYISQQLKIPTVQQGTTILDVLEPHPHPLTQLFPPLANCLVLCCPTGRDAIGNSKIVAI